jgi:hypothetical protein
MMRKKIKVRGYLGGARINHKKTPAIGISSSWGCFKKEFCYQQFAVALQR